MRELVVARQAGEPRDLALDLGERQPIGVADDRHDQAALGADRDAEVDEVLVDDVGAVDLGVDQRACRCSAATQARAKNDMKPSADAVHLLRSAPCARARSAITALMSTSLKVVRIAAVCCAWTQALGDALAQAGHRHALLVVRRSAPAAPRRAA